MTADVLRVLLLLSAICLFSLAIFYLTRREMPIQSFLGWGLLAVVIPFLGPFLVIVTQPGTRRSEPKQSKSNKLIIHT